MEQDFCALLKQVDFREIAQPKFGPRKVGKNASRPTEFIFNRAKTVIEVGFVLGLTV